MAVPVGVGVEEEGGEKADLAGEVVRRLGREGAAEMVPVAEMSVEEVEGEGERGGAREVGRGEVG